MILKHDHGDYVFAEGSTEYGIEWPFEAETGELFTSVGISAEIWADDHVRLVVAKNGDELCIGNGRSFNIDKQFIGFDTLFLRAKKQTKIAYKIRLKFSGDQEDTDDTPVVLGAPPDRDPVMDARARQLLHARMLQMGVDNATAQDIVDGLDNLDDDLEFDEDDDLLTDAELEDAEAETNLLSQQETDDPNDPDDPPAEFAPDKASPEDETSSE